MPLLFGKKFFVVVVVRLAVDAVVVVDVAGGLWLNAFCTPTHTQKQTHAALKNNQIDFVTSLICNANTTAHLSFGQRYCVRQKFGY